jgi:hypothetical protein
MHRAWALVFVLACGESDHAIDGGLDAAPDVPHFVECNVPEADAGPPTYRWSFNQQSILENNGLIPPATTYLDPKSGFECSDGPNCGCYFFGQLSLGDLGANPPAPRRWRISAWFRGTNDGVLFDFEDIRLTLQSEELAIARTSTPETFTTLLNAGDRAWHAVALQVDATVTPLSIEVFLDKNAPFQSPSTLSWTLSTSTYLVIGGTDADAGTNDFDEISFFLYE